MPGCVFKKCLNNNRNIKKVDGITYHTFPSQTDIREKWIRLVQLERNDEYWLPLKGSRICSAHFNEGDTYFTQKGRRFLKKQALPSAELGSTSPPGRENTSSPASPINFGGNSDLESLLDTPRKIALKKRVRQLTNLKCKHSAKINALQKKNQRLTKKCNSIKEILQHLKAGNFFDASILTLLAPKPEVRQLFDIYLKKLHYQKKNKKFRPSYPPFVKKFALTLNYYSPAAYKYVRDVFGKALPNPRTLGTWYKSVNAAPGFTTEAFEALKLKHTAEKQRLMCSLVVDEIHIRHQKIWTGNKFVGVVDTGNKTNDEGSKIATEAFVLMVVSLNQNWKIPIGYFLVNGLPAENKADFIKIALHQCHVVGVDILALIFDGCPSNIRAANILGCQLSDIANLRTSFKHPSTAQNVFVMLDACHMIKLVRNHFEKKRILFNASNRSICWHYLVSLNKLQKNEKLHFANKLSDRHINFRNQIMKVRLATQLLSMSVASALKLCDELLISTKFIGSADTVEFITIMNNLFDILNSRKNNFYVFKCPLGPQNKSEIFAYLNKAKIFIQSLKIYTKTKRTIKRRVVLKIFKKNILSTECNTGFLGLIICIESLKGLYEEHVELKNNLKYISTYRLSQDHLELFFGNIRNHGGNNNNPTAVQFMAAYRKVLCHLELKSTFTGNCIPLDNFCLLSTSSIRAINATSLRNIGEEEIFEATDEADRACDTTFANNCFILSNLLDREQELSVSLNLIVGYISGWVVRKLLEKIKCEQCLESVLSKSKLYFHQLIVIKDMGGLCYPSESVFKVCLTIEKLIRRFILENDGKTLPSTLTLQYITSKGLEMFIGSEVFADLSEHSMDAPATFNHRVHLIRAILQMYIKVRFHHEAKSDPFITKLSKWQKRNKLSIFEGK